eukprot:5946648-Amphidinium_carterae.3
MGLRVLKPCMLSGLEMIQLAAKLASLANLGFLVWQGIAEGHCTKQADRPSCAGISSRRAVYVATSASLHIIEVSYIQRSQPSDVGGCCSAPYACTVHHVMLRAWVNALPAAAGAGKTPCIALFATHKLIKGICVDFLIQGAREAGGTGGATRTQQAAFASDAKAYHTRELATRAGWRLTRRWVCK